MALLSLSNIEKSFGPREVLKGLSLGVERGDRLGLIGRFGVFCSGMWLNHSVRENKVTE
ncbi:MAG TPA: hypothetical protein VKX17_10600 [Planctomycetota bacterium]|nr:hypothetical protein [Planctomycetota bacterium]